MDTVQAQPPRRKRYVVSRAEIEAEMQQMWDMAHNRHPLPGHMTRQNALDRWYELKEQLERMTEKPDAV